jgi:N-acetylmuramoyl-L-alanine amidase
LTSSPIHIAARLILLAMTSIIAIAQQPTPRITIYLDPAHGGPDTGAHLPNNLLEKDVTLAFAARLRAALTSAGFTIIATRDADPATTFTTDQRAEIGNHAHPSACIILHATSSGSGIHVITSALTPPSDPDDFHTVTPWDTAQSGSIAQSLSLANDIGLALQHAKLPAILSRASLRPLANLTCPAVAIEIAPSVIADSDPTPITDPAYQQNVAKALTAALISWRTHQAAATAAAGNAGAAK